MHYKQLQLVLQIIIHLAQLLAKYVRNALTSVLIVMEIIQFAKPAVQDIYFQTTKNLAMYANPLTVLIVLTLKEELVEFQKLTIAKYVSQSTDFGKIKSVIL